jgi:TonB family protein
VEGAGHATLGDLALNTIKKSNPFPMLPSEFTGTSLGVRAEFRYEGGMTSAAPTATEVSVDGVKEPVYSLSRAITPPTPIYQPEPEYSEEARRKSVSGIVLLKLVVTAKGDTSNIMIARSLGSGLDEKAIEAVRQWKFKPATKDGEPVSVQIAVEVSFHVAKREP